MVIKTRSEGSANGAVPGDLRRHNRGLLLDLLSRHGAMSRKDIAAQTRLTAAAISRIARELVDAGLVTEGADGEEQAGRNGNGVRGRPSVSLRLAPGGGFVAGVGIGAYEQWVQVANLRGACVSRRALKLLGARTPAKAITELAAQVRSLADEARIPRGRLLGVGVAIAGVVDPARAVVLHSPNIGWDGVALGESLARATRLPVVVEAMHHALNLAEARHGAMRGVADAVLVNAAMGIGASVMEEGRIVRGSHGAAGQIGHMRVARASELCTCGRRGCLDTVASGYAVLRRLGAVAARRKAGEHGTGYAQRLLAATERERAGERAAKAAFRACGEQLGEALNAVRAVFDPARIVLAGPLSQTGSYVEGVRARLGTEPQVFLATHSTDAAAANLALVQLAFGPRLDLSRLRA